jgi:hypothetical protein
MPHRHFTTPLHAVQRYFQSKKEKKAQRYSGLTLNSSLTASTAGLSTCGLRLGEAGGGGMLALPSLLRS